jgi:hypothetical protein
MSSAFASASWWSVSDGDQESPTGGTMTSTTIRIGGGVSGATRAVAADRGHQETVPTCLP